MILSIGDLLLDITIVPHGPLMPDDDNPSEITIGGGGQAANFCAWVAELGSPVRLVTGVGDDDRGHSLVAGMKEFGVEVFPIWSTEPTGAVAVLIGPNGERTMATQRGASVGLRPEDLRQQWFTGVRLIHVPAYSLFLDPLASATRAAIAMVRMAGGLLSIDLSSAAGLKAFGGARMASELSRIRPEVLFATEAESATLGKPLEGLAAIPILKLGPAGARIGGRLIPAPQVRAVDPTGAGDAFAAAFCTSYLGGASPIAAAEHAVMVASGAVARTGARPG
jgi:sugar/nucleoside kinase (ribokinase family)